MFVRCNNVCSLHSRNQAEIVPQRIPLLHQPVCPDPGQAWNCLNRGNTTQTQRMRQRTGGFSFFVLSLDNEQDCQRFQAVKEHGPRYWWVGGWVGGSDGREKDTCIGNVSDSVHDYDRSPRIETCATQDALKPHHNMTKRYAWQQLS